MNKYEKGRLQNEKRQEIKLQTEKSEKTEEPGYRLEEILGSLVAPLPRGRRMQ